MLSLKEWIFIFKYIDYLLFALALLSLFVDSMTIGDSLGIFAGGCFYHIIRIFWKKLKKKLLP